ncbi:MAG: bis(5'-nucleosyl)-tetraphosphatase (symmetrical) YqeK [Elainellaceae cyanobacterium]
MGELPEGLRQHVLDWLADNVPESRINHVLRVEQMAVALAQAHGLDQQKAAQAGLMHDLAKYFKPQTLLVMAEQEGLPIDPVDEANPHLLHAAVGAIVARDTFGVQDSEVLAAIANHTLGQPGMSPLSCVVFLADSLEPGRGDVAELVMLRKLSQQDLQQTVWMTCDYTLRHLMNKHRLLHPRVIQTRNWFLHHSNKQVFKRQRQPSTHFPDQIPS